MNAESKDTPADARGRAEVLANAQQVAADGIRSLDRVESELARLAVMVAAARLEANTARTALEALGASASALQGKVESDG